MKKMMIHNQAFKKKEGLELIIQANLLVQKKTPYSKKEGSHRASKSRQYLPHVVKGATLGALISRLASIFGIYCAELRNLWKQISNFWGFVPPPPTTNHIHDFDFQFMQGGWMIHSSSLQSIPLVYFIVAGEQIAASLSRNEFWETLSQLSSLK